MGKKKIEDSILFSYNNNISQDTTTESIMQNENVIERMTSSSSQEETRFITSEKKEVIQKLESEIKNLKCMIQNKKDSLQKKEIQLQDKQKQITELTQLNITLQKDVINIYKGKPLICFIKVISVSLLFSLLFICNTEKLISVVLIGENITFIFFSDLSSDLKKIITRDIKMINTNETDKRVAVGSVVNGKVFRFIFFIIYIHIV